MGTWQHTSGMDYLRNKAEGLISRARGEKKASFAAGGKNSVQKPEINKGFLDNMSDNPEFGTATGGFRKEN